MTGQDAVVDAVSDAGLDATTALVAAYLGAVETASNWLPNMCHAVYARATRGEAHQHERHEEHDERSRRKRSGVSGA
jgi:hypothetical protein